MPQDWSIFELPDPMFVAEAYLRVLGRPADPAGFLAYSRALRAGRSRTKLLLAMQKSAEARARCKPNVPTASAFVDPALWPAGLHWRGGGRHRPTSAVMLALHGDLFVDALCAFVLHRRLDLAEWGRWVASSADLDGRKSLLRTATAELPWFRRGLMRKRRCRLLPRPRRMPHPGTAAPTASSEAPGPRPRPSGLDRLRGLAGAGAFTIATRSYLPYVRVLMRSLRQQHPDFHLLCLLVDEPDTTEQSVEADNWTVIAVADLEFAGFDDMTWRYDATELCTALKPMFFQWLLEHTKLDSIFYVDPDIRFFGPMTEASALLAAGVPMILTPHILAPIQDDGSQPSGQTILASGSFNLGFAAIGRHPQARAFVAWWADRLRTDAVVDFAANRFTDQRWCDMAPSFVADLAILRNPGYNVAYWNLGQRRLLRNSSGAWTSNAQALVFFHFSGIDPSRPRQVSRHQDRLQWDDLGECQSLFEDYMADLRSAGWHPTGRAPRTYDSVDGVDISPTLRRLYRDIHVQPTLLSRRDILAEMLQLCVAGESDGSQDSAELTPLMKRLHGSRPDLAAHFDLADPQAARDYCAWFWAGGASEHGLESLLRRAAQTSADRRP